MEQERLIDQQHNEPSQTNTQDLRINNILNVLYQTDYWYRLMSVPKRYWLKSLKNFNEMPKEFNEAMKDISENRSVYISGNTGSGKTHLAVGLMIYWIHCQLIKKNFDRARVNEEIILTGEFPIFISSVEFFLELKETFYGKRGETENDVIERYCKFPLLTIDDVGAEKVSDWSRQMFYLLIDRRYRDCKQTIITSNLSLSQISELIDDRIASRIAGMGSVITLTGTDYRLKM